MNRYDLIAFDMDGTLLDSGKRILPSTIEALKEADAAGKIVALSTGRSPAELKEYYACLPMLRYVICMSGALVYDIRENRVIFEKQIPGFVVEKMFEVAEHYDAMLHNHSMASVTEKQKIPRMEEYHMAVYQDMFSRVALAVDDLPAYYRKERYPVFKFNYYMKDPAQRPQIREELSQLDLTVVFAELSSVECSARGISKAYGLKVLCDELGIDICRTIAVGDGDNDLEILKAAGLSVAMGNAGENVLSAADVTVASNDEGGCAEAIYKYLL